MGVNLPAEDKQVKYALSKTSSEAIFEQEQPVGSRGSIGK
jgi:hypothetical protein